MFFIYFSLYKFAKFLISFFKAQVSFSSNFASIFTAIKHKSSVLSLAQTLNTSVKGANYRANFLDFWVFESKFFKFLMSILKWLVSSSSNFASFFVVMTYNSSLNFNLIHFLLWTIGSHQGPNFDTFNCSGENFPNFSCHFSNHKSVFLRILHHSSVPWKITPLYFFGLDNIYFAQKERIRVNLFKTFKYLGQN